MHGSGRQRSSPSGTSQQERYAHVRVAIDRNFSRPVRRMLTSCGPTAADRAPEDGDHQGHHGLDGRSERRLPVRVDRARSPTRKGSQRRRPRPTRNGTDVRSHALMLLEAPNLLIMDGRKVAAHGEKSKNPEVELQPEQIQKLIDDDRPSFVRRARRLQDAAASALTAIDRQGQGRAVPGDRKRRPGVRELPSALLVSERQDEPFRPRRRRGP